MSNLQNIAKNRYNHFLIWSIKKAIDDCESRREFSGKNYTRADIIAETKKYMMLRGY